MALVTNVTRLLEARKIPYAAYETPPEKLGALETARFLNVAPASVFKTIVVTREKGKPLLAVVPGDSEADLKLLAAALGEKKVHLPTEREAERLTGLQAGRISPLALVNKGFQVVIDSSAQALGEIHVSGGQRGLIIKLSAEALAKLEVKHGITAENLGYILRCNPPTGFDKEYCRKLGWGAIDYFMRGGRGAIITIKEGRIVPKPFEKAMDKNGRIKTRKVDLNSVDYRMSQTYQVRLIREDFEDEDKLKKLAKTTNLSPEAFRDRFGYLAGIGLKPGRPKYAWNLE